MSTPPAGLTTRGRCLLAAGAAAAVCAVALDERDLLRVAAFAVLLPLLAALVAGRGRVGLRAERELVPPRTPAGAGTGVRLTVHSSGRLAGGVLFEDRMPAVFGAVPRFVVSGVRRREAVALHYPLVAAQRGVYPLGPLAARITDPFGLAEYHRELGGRSRLVVTPPVVALTGMPGGAGSAVGAGGEGAPRSGTGADAVVVRPYQQGDELRKVHWRSTARRDELMVRAEEHPWLGGAAVLLDHRDTAHRGAGPGASLEFAVSLAASVCVHLLRHGQRVHLVTGDGRTLAGAAEQGAHGSEAVLDALAALGSSAGRSLHDPPVLGTASEVVAVLGATDAADVERLSRRRPRGLRSHAVLLDVGTWPRDAGTGARPPADPAYAARLLSAAGWSAVVVAHGETATSVWNRVCAGAADTPAVGR